MKPFLTRCLTLSALAVTIPGKGMAERETLAFDWQAFAGLLIHDADSSLGNGRMASMSNSVLLGGRLGAGWRALGGLEVELPAGLTDSTDNSAAVMFLMPRAHARVDVLTGQEHRLFVLAGAGLPIALSNNQSALESDLTFGGYLGVGGESNFGRGLKVRLDARWGPGPALGDNALASDFEFLVTVARRSDQSPKQKLVADLDGDGVVGAADRCPDEPEDADEIADGNGCPERDADKDGVLDGLDRCPSEDEVWNGFEDGDGCVDIVPDEVLSLEGLVVGVDFTSGSVKSATRLNEQINAIAKTMLAHPSVQIVVHGYTDDRGDDDANLELSQARAEVVRELLAEAGVASGRVLAVGHGEATPIGPNETEQGRRRNRRIEIELLVDKTK